MILAATTSGLVAGGVVIVAAIALATVQARRRTLTRRPKDAEGLSPKDDPAPGGPRPDGS